MDHIVECVPNFSEGRNRATVQAMPDAVVAGDRLFFSSCFGFDPEGKIPADSALQTKLALGRLESVLKAAGIGLDHVVFVNPYITEAVVPGEMNKEYAKHFKFGDTPARATIHVTHLPHNAGVVFTGVAAMAHASRRSVRPKNMPPSPTASPCVFVGNTLYCSAKSAFIPGPNLGVYAESVENQVRQTMRNLVDGLEEAGMSLADVVATNVYLDDIKDFAKMNRVYASYFKAPYPRRAGIRMNRLNVVQHTSADYLGLMEDHLEGRRIRFHYFRPFTEQGNVPGPGDTCDGLVLLGGGPWGSAGGRDVPILQQEIVLTRAMLDMGKPVIGIGLGAQILEIAPGGGSEPAPLAFEVGHARRVIDDALAGFLPARYPHVVYMRDHPLPPPDARVLAVDEQDRPALFQIIHISPHLLNRRRKYREDDLRDSTGPVDCGYFEDILCSCCPRVITANPVRMNISNFHFRAFSIYYR